MPLSDTSVRNAKAQDKALKLFDGGGLFLFVSPAGGKLWRLKYRFQGKEKLLALGAYPDISLKDARKRRDEAKELLAKDIDPAEVKKEAKATAAALELEMATTFEAVAREWFSKKRHAWTPGHQKKILSRLENQLFPILGAKLFSSLEPGDFLAAIQKAESRGAIETAHRLAQLCGQVSRYARIVGHTRYDVAAGLTEALTPVQTNHYATITDPAEVGHLLRAIDEYTGEPSICFALKVLPFVFVRSVELRGAEWNEFDFEAATWVSSFRVPMKPGGSGMPTYQQQQQYPTPGVDTSARLSDSAAQVYEQVGNQQAKGLDKLGQGIEQASKAAYDLYSDYQTGNYVEQCQNELERAAKKPGKGASHE